MTQTVRPPQEFQKIPVPADLANRPIPITENAREVLSRRYLRKGDEGTPIENEQEMFWRVAYHIALAEAENGGTAEDIDHWARKFFDLLTNLRFFPNSPTFTGAGTPLGQLAACFVLAVEDDMGRTGSGIFSTLRHAALIQQTGGGNGFSFSRLRPAGARVKSSGGTATGPIGFMKVYDQAFDVIAQGGCLTPDTLVFTEAGTLRLDEIVTHQDGGWRKHDLMVSTDEGQRHSTQAFNNGVASVLRLTTAEGLEITGTPNHKFKVMTTNGAEWKRLDEIEAGDAILVQLGQHQGQPQTMTLPEQQHHNQVMPTISPELDEAWAFFLGCLAGDGFVASNVADHRIGISVAHDSYLMDEMPRLMSHLFGDHINIHCQQKADDASVTYVIDNRAIKDFLLINDLGKESSTEVHVPRLIRQSPAHIVGAYLRGLFEADGSISHGYPHLLSSSEALVREVATLLIGLGCPVTIRQVPASESRYGTTQMWDVRINSYVGLKAWKQNIGCAEESRFAVCLDFAPDLTRETSYVLPHAEYWIDPVLNATQMPQIDRQHRGQGKNFRASDPQLRRKLLRYTRGDRNLTASAYATLAETHVAFAEYAVPLQDLWFVTVESVVDAGKSLTLDIEVEDNHTYIANGMVTHNSRRGANMGVLRVDHPDIRQFIACKSTEGEIANFNISVAITDKFMEAVINDTDFDLINPSDDTVWETVRAREIFDMIIEYAHHNGEPGVLFIDEANRSNPVPHLYDLEATNPCVTGDTLVATPEGWRRVDEIAIDDEICTINGVGTVDTIEVNLDTPVYEVSFADGGTIRATAAHQFHIYDEITGQFNPTRLDETAVGEWIRVYRQEVPMLQPALAMGAENATLVDHTQDTTGCEQMGSDWATQIVSIEYVGNETVYDLYEPTTDTWITNGYVSRGCGEQWLGPFENCCLGSVNLAQHITEDGDVDWIKLKESIQLSTRFLDNVVTANAYVPAIPELREAAEKVRRIGLGIMGLADMMYALGVRYGSLDGQEFASQIMEFVRYTTMQTSIELAKERGPFKAIKGSRYDADDLQWQPPVPIVEHKSNWGRPTLDWDKIEDGIRKHGIRNGAQLTVAPTGTIATVTGCEGYGCEPVFALAYMRYVNKNAGNSDEQITLQYTSPQFEKALHEAGLNAETIDYIIEQVNLKGSCQDIDEVPDDLRNTFVVASDITVEEHIRMQAALQAHVDNAISKTINAPAHATMEDVAQAYKLGWELGCKGLTVYVTGSRQKVVLETAETKAEKESTNEIKEAVVESAEKQLDAPYIFNHQKKPRPRRLTGYTYRTPTPAGTTYITVNENGHGAGQPFEVFMHTEKAGSEIAAVSEAMGRLMSLILRLSSPVSPRDRIKQIERQLRGIGGRRQWGYGPNRVASLPDGVAQIMRDYLMDTEEGEDSPAMISAYNGHSNGHGGHHYHVENLPSDANYADDGTVEEDFMMKIGDLCPECGQAAFVREEGCSRCYSCGFSEC